ncbi:hypothetical protein ACS0TY_013515 [Phlomoides rotata]
MSCMAWHPPPVGRRKLNVDAAFFQDSLQGIGMVLRDEYGTFLEGRTKLLDCYPEVNVGEAIGFFEALSWLKEMNYGEVIVEEDAKIVVDAVNSTKDMNSVFGDCIHQCKFILRPLQYTSLLELLVGLGTLALGLIHQILW